MCRSQQRLLDTQDYLRITGNFAVRRRMAMPTPTGPPVVDTENLDSRGAFKGKEKK